MRLRGPGLLTAARYLVLACLAVLLASTANAYLALNDVQKRITYRIPENTIWAASQSEVELARTLAKLAPRAAGLEPRALVWKDDNGADDAQGDAAGLGIVAAFEAACDAVSQESGAPPALLYLVPTFANPTALTLGAPPSKVKRLPNGAWGTFTLPRRG